MSTKNEQFSKFSIQKMLEEIKDRLLLVADMISIYFSEVSLDGTKLYFINVIYDEEVLFKEEQFIAIKNIQNEYSEFNIQIFKERQLKGIIANFNSYVLLHIYSGKIIYGSPPIPDILNNIDFIHYLSTSKANFRKEQLKILAFMEDQNFSLKGESNAYTSFGLHQSIELSFRILEQFFGGKALISHSLTAHIEYLETLIPNIRFLFIEDEVEKERVLEKLDRAYIAARYTINCHIEDEHLNTIFVYFQKIFYLTQYIYNWQYKTCTSSINTSTDKSIKSILKSIQTTQQTLVDYVVANYSIHSIYRINEATSANYSHTKCAPWLDGHKALQKHTLLIITNERLDKSENDLMHELDQYFQEQFKTYILLDDIMHVATKLDEGGSYLEYLLKSSNRLYSLDKRLFRYEYGGEYFFPVEYYNKTAEWSKRKDRAEYIIRLMQDVEEKEDYATHLFLTHQLIIQVCLGLLDLFWNLRPTVTHLPYLVNLINHFSHHTTSIFNHGNFKNPGILEGITNSPQYMLTTLPYNFDYKDMDELFSACLEFMEQTNDVADKRLNDIKINAFQGYVSIEDCFNKSNDQVKK